MRIGPQRPVNPDAIAVPSGYRVEALVTGLTFPSAISFGPGGEIYLAESGGIAGRVVAVPRVLRIDPDRSVNEIGRLENPIVGLVYRAGELLIGEDGPSPRVLRVTAEGEVKIVVEGLPGGGDHGLSGLALDASGALLFGMGTRTNSGVVGLDNVARGWVARNPEWSDIPGAEVKLAGVNYVTTQPTAGGAARHSTGGFKPFGRRSQPNEAVQGSLRCSGGVFRLPMEGGDLERLAWGFRNPVGLAVTPDGRILTTEGGMEERGSRPIAGASDNLWEVRSGQWYGWPDFAGGVSVADARFRLPGHPLPRRLAPNLPDPTVSPLATFGARSGVGRLDVSQSDRFGLVGQALVALSGEWSPATYPSEDAPGGYRVVSVDLATGQATDFLVNRQRGPASASNSGGLERPFDVRFDPTGEVLYVVDLGEVNLSRELGLEPYGGTGVLWRITRTRTQVTSSGPVGRSAERTAAPATLDTTPEDDEDEADDVSEDVSDEASETPVEDTEEATSFEAPETEAAAEEAGAEPQGAVLAGETLSADLPASEAGEEPSGEPGGLSLEPLESGEPSEGGLIPGGALVDATPDGESSAAPQHPQEDDQATDIGDIAEGAPEAHPQVGEESGSEAEADSPATEAEPPAGDAASEPETSEAEAGEGTTGEEEGPLGSPEQAGGE